MGGYMYRGIFWIVDEETLSNNDKYFIKINTDSNGTVIDYEYPLNSKNKDNYNHCKTWNNLPYELTRSKPFNYYPRGRIEIKKNKCKIFLNPSLNKEEIINYIIGKFELKEIKNIKIIEDYSYHYKAMGKEKHA